MHIRADRDALAEAFGRANRGVGAKSATPILQGILCKTSDNRLHLLGSDQDITVRTAVEVKVLEEGSFVVPGRLMTDVIRRMPEGAITLRLTGGEVEVSGNGPRFTIRTWALDEFPVLEDPDLRDAVELDGQVLVSAIAQVSVAASTDSTRPALTGVLIENSDQGVRMVATDSYRLALREIAGAEVNGSGVVPSRGLRELARTIASDQVSVAIGEREVVFSSDKGTLSIRLIATPFPNYVPLLPKSFPNEMVLSRDRLLEALSRAALVAGDNIPIELTFSEEGLNLEVRRQELGGESESVEGDYRGEAAEMNISFNYPLLNDGVSVLEGDEVSITVVEPFKPGYIRAKGREEFIYLLMPVRSKN